MTMILRYFKADSEKGERLFSLVSNSIPTFLANELGIQVTVIPEDSEGLLPDGGKQPSAFRVLQSALNNEIVVIDASIEEIKGKELGVNYECITPAVSSLDNVLVVSRTELPLNFIPCRSNVAPLGHPDLTDAFEKSIVDSSNLRVQDIPSNDVTKFKKEYTNAYILAWIMFTLLKMHKNGRLVRDGLDSIDLANPSGDMFKRELQIMEENVNAAKKEKGNRRKSFISYRSCYYPPKGDDKDKKYKYNGKYDIKDIEKIVDEYHHDPDHKDWEKPFYYPKGVLSRELMPEIRRWAFVALPDRVIREADEFWIFETKYQRDKDGKKKEVGYWDSWWCLGEFITIIRMKYSGQLKKNFKFIIFNPDDDQIVEIPFDQIPSMTDEQNRELARYFANGDFLEAGYESMGNMRKMQKKPKWIRWFYFQFLKRYVWPKIMPSEDIKGFKFKYYNDSVESHVYDDKFMTDRIFLDEEQAERGLTREEVFNDKDLIWKFLNINGYYTESRKIPRYPGSSVENNNIAATDEQFYLFWTPRMGKRTGPNSCIIEVVPLYIYIK